MALLANVASGDPIAPSWGNSIRDQTCQVTTSGARPGVPAEGMLIYETDTDKLMCCTGAAWVEVMRNGAWDVHVPTVKLGATTVTIANDSRWMRIGRTAFVELGCRFTNLNGGTGSLTATRPINGRANDITVRQTYVQSPGVGMLMDLSAASAFRLFVSGNSADKSDVAFHTTASPAGTASNTVPFTIVAGALNTGDELSAQYCYEIV